MFVLRIPFLVGLVLGLGLSISVSVNAGPVVPVHELATASWPYMSAEQRALVDVMARDHYEMGTTPAQKRRISGQTNGRYDALPEWRKAPFRGIALRQLGHHPDDFRRDAV